MNVSELLSSTHVTRIYSNYNKIYLVDNKWIVKHFFEPWRLQKEFEVINALKKQGFELLPQIEWVSQPYIVYDYVDFPSFGERLKSGQIAVNQLVEIPYLIPSHIPLEDRFSFKIQKAKGFVLKSMPLLETNFPVRALRRIRMILRDYQLLDRKFIHGDMRPDNVLGLTKVECIVDWEMAEFGDINREFAYLYFGTWLRDVDTSDLLLNAIGKLSEFREQSFLFYIVYIYTACLENPKLNNYHILKGLKDVLTKFDV